MQFRKSKEMKVQVYPEQEKQISSKDKITAECQKENVIAFDIYADELLIGFAMLRKYSEEGFFLWNYAIDFKYQNRNLGTVALKELIDFLRKEYNLKEMTTTYILGNHHAKHIYEKIGFTQTDIVDEVECHEVNMVYKGFDIM